MQSPINIPNGSGAQVRADINRAIESVASFYSGTTDPATMTPSSARPFMLWADTLNNQIKQRNATNTQWVIIGAIIDGRFVFDIQGALPKASPINTWHYVYRDVVAIRTASNQTGTLKITLPAQATSVLTIVIKGITSANSGDWEAKISAYAVPTGWQVTFESATVSHNCPFSDVRLGLDTGGKYVILLGNTTTLWGVPQVAITEVRACYSNPSVWGGNWSMTFTTDETSITVNRTPQVRRILTSPNIVTNSYTYRDVGGTKLANFTGTLQIVLPRGTNGFIAFSIKGTDSSDALGGWFAQINGRMTTGSPWFTVGNSGYNVILSPSCPFDRVRFGRTSDGLPCILLGTTGTVWGYPIITINELITDSQLDGSWALNSITNETGIIVQRTITPKILATKDDIDKLATKDDIDKLATKEDIDNRHTIIYPNGGSKASPANISINSRYETAIPSGFEGYELICETELFVNSVWTPAEFWVYTDRSSGTRSTLFNNKIITQTGVGLLTLPGTYLGQPNNAITGSNITIAPCRVKIYKLSKVVV